MDEALATMVRRCAAEYDIATDYFSMTVTASTTRPDSCKSWQTYNVRQEAIDLLKEDGLCTAATKKKWPEGGLGWNKAAKHVGKVKRVCGPLQSARETEHGTFLNVGRDYPNAKRFTFVMWDIYLNPIADGAVICAKGEIYLYEGVTQMEVNSAKALEIWQ